MRRALALLWLLVLAVPASAAETAYLYDTTPPQLRIVALDAVGTQFGDPLPITGLGAGDSIAAIDIRPSDGRLYALTVNTATDPDHAELYRLDVGADSVSALSIGIPDFVPSSSLGVAFHPETGRLRVVSPTGLNLRLNADTAAVVANDSAPAFAEGDPNDGQVPNISGIAYAGSTLLAIAGADEFLARIGGAGGSPSPNSGEVFTIGATGVGSGLGQDSLDVSAATGAIWWLRNDLFRADVWRLDPATGRRLSGVPFDFSGAAIALLPAANVFLGSSRAGYYTEADGMATLQVWRSDVLTGETTVPYEVRDASAGVASANGVITFADGETQKPLNVPIPQDTAVEGTQFFTVRTGEPAGNRNAGAVGGNQEMTVIVSDDDAAPVATPSPSPTPAADRVRPALRITGVPRRALTRAQLLRGFRVRVLPSEMVSLDVSLRANPRRGVFTSAYELSLFSKRFARSPFTRSVRVRPSKRLVGPITRRAKLRLRFEAMDAAGNRTTVNRTITVRR